MSGNQKDLDERMRARHEHSKKQERKRKTRVGAFYLLFLLFIITVGVILSLTVFFHIEKIEVSGDSRYSAEEIILKSNIKKGENLFVINIKNARSSIEKKLPYIESAIVTRSFPTGVKITVTEAKAVGAFLENEKYILTNTNSKVLDIVDEKPEDIALIQGFGLKSFNKGEIIEYQNEVDKETFSDVLEGFEKIALSGITNISVENSIRLTAVYKNRILIKFGAPVDINDKMNFIKNYLQDHSSEYDRGVLDISNPQRGYFDQSKSFEGQEDAGVSDESN